MRIGIDVGGTHTDAVIMRGSEVLAATKAETSANVSDGILAALETVLEQSGIAEIEVEAVMLGTTQFTNAVVERRELAHVAAIRLGLPSGRGLEPKAGWPDDIAEALGGRSYLLEGGFLYDGRELSPFDERTATAVVEDIAARAIDCVSIASAFSPMNPEPERRMAAMLRDKLPNVRITESHRIGRLGILERENAALLNAALLPFAERVVSSFAAALKARGLTCPFFVSQNDGTLMDASFVREFPALTFASGPTNSLRGAARLTGLDNAIVIDIGGTTSDIGVLQDGFPRESNLVIEVGGVRTNFRMPDILALGLGGGSLVDEQGTSIGPKSVGHCLMQEGRVFGGDTLTATDIVVAAGKAQIGDVSRVTDLDAGVVDAALTTIRTMLNDGIERMKPSSDALPVILVGGGAILLTSKPDAAAELHRPEHSDVANAIGAAIAQVGGEAERMVSYEQVPRKEALAQIGQEAVELAVAAGAERSTVAVADIEETTLSYMDGGTTRVRVKAVGEVALLSGEAS
ncbi:MAG: hydantoinase/oxoprolinase family protein [Pseudomonadota bacterium]